MKHETVLVTGGAGFIGSHVSRHLLSSGRNVVVLDDLSGGFKENVPRESHFVEGDTGNIDLIDDLFEKYEFSHVFHLAAYAAEGLSHFIRGFNYRNNLLGSVPLINAAIRHKCKTLVYTSSIAVYGANQLPMTEDLMPSPEDPYGIAKLAVELDLKAAQHMFGLNYIIFRPHNVYGIRQNIGDPYRNVIGIFMNQIMQGKPLTIFGDGTQTRAFSHIDEVAPHIAASVDIPEAQNQIFNIGADQTYSVCELARGVLSSMKSDLPLEFLPPRNEVQHAYASHEKAQSVFTSNRNPVTLRDGLREMAEWARVVGVRTGKAFEGIELIEGLPPSWKKLLK